MPDWNQLQNWGVYFTFLSPFSSDFRVELSFQYGQWHFSLWEWRVDEVLALLNQFVENNTRATTITTVLGLMMTVAVLYVFWNSIRPTHWRLWAPAHDRRPQRFPNIDPVVEWGRGKVQLRFNFHRGNLVVSLTGTNQQDA